MRIQCLILLLLLAPVARAADKTEVVTSLPYLAEVVRAVGGDRVSVRALAPPGEDPHYISTSPKQTALLRKAQLFVENGVALEPWTAKVLKAAQNPAIQPGQPGHVYAATGIRTMDRPTKAEVEAGGHVHAGGNPHVWLDPLNLKQIARNVAGALSKVDPSSSATFEANRKSFEKRLDAALYGEKLAKLLGARTLDKLYHGGRLASFLKSKKYKGKPLIELAGGLLARSLALRGAPVFTYHSTWRYLEVSFGLQVVGTVEEKPGIPASPAHLGKLRSISKQRGARLVLVAPYYPLTRAQAFAKEIGGQAVVLPTQPGEAGAPADLLEFYSDLFARLERAVQAK